MTWSEWLYFGATLTFQVTACVGSDGVAFVAEAALVFLTYVGFVVDATAAVNACSSTTMNACSSTTMSVSSHSFFLQSDGSPAAVLTNGQPWIFSVEQTLFIAFRSPSKYGQLVIANSADGISWSAPPLSMDLLAWLIRQRLPRSRTQG